MRHIALLPDDPEMRWCQKYSFSPLRSPQRGPLINPVHVICAAQPEVSHTALIHMWLEGWRSNFGFIDLLSCTSSLPLYTISHQRILVCPRTSKSWNFLKILKIFRVTPVAGLNLLPEKVPCLVLFWLRVVHTFTILSPFTLPVWESKYVCMCACKCVWVSVRVC